MLMVVNASEHRQALCTILASFMDLGCMLMQLQNKRILLGVTGGIAAYKAAEIVRRLRELRADVRVVADRCRERIYYAADLTGGIRPYRG